MAASPEQSCYTLINAPPDVEAPTEHKLKEDLEGGSVKAKTEALKKVITMIINGEKFNNILMTIIRFVMPEKDHTIKKLLMIFWEVVPKYGPDGKLLHEMILVCDAYRKDLQHANEYIRGSTLRFLCKLKEPELLEPLMPSIRSCLESRYPYVRRNAVMAIFTIYKNFESLIPDGSELIAKYLESESDASCKRNAFIMLLHVDQEKALAYLTSCLDQVHTFGDILQLVIVELIYKVCHANSNERARFIRCVYNLLQSTSPSVRYEAAGTLITLTSAPTAVKAVASCYIDLILKESDNNVKLIVLGRLMSLRDSHERVMQDQLMDIIRILGASDLEVRMKTLELALDLVTSRTVEELVNILKKELVKLFSDTSVGTGSTGKDDITYRGQLIKTLHLICMRYPEMIPGVLSMMCEQLTEPESKAKDSGEVITRFLREAAQRFPSYKSQILERLIEVYPNITHKVVTRLVLWILGEYSESLAEINAFMSLMHQVLGPMPYVDVELKRRLALEEGEESGSTSQHSAAPKTRVTADGTYITESALTINKDASRKGGKKEIQRPALMQVLCSPDFMPAVVLSGILAKLFVRLYNLLSDTDPKRINSFSAECMLIIAGLIHLGRTDLLSAPVNPDHYDRMCLCLKVIAERDPGTMRVFGQYCRDQMQVLVESQEADRKLATIKGSKKSKVRQQADETIKIVALSAGASDLGDLEDRFDLTLNQALGKGAASSRASDDLFSASKLSKITQLTGFSDPIYAEAYVQVNQYDIIVDVLVVNRTSDTLQNLTLELATLGDLKLVEKPSPLTMAPNDFTNIRANIKVSSSENGIIFGNIVYDVRSSGGECNVVVLNDIHVDIMEYITPADIGREDFRKMWLEYEWENKVTVNTHFVDLHQFLKHMISHTNMKCLLPDKALEGECNYLCVTMFAKSIFGENVLGNMCLEKPLDDNSTVIGHVRIRAKTQGMAVTMGDKMSKAMKLPA